MITKKQTIEYIYKYLRVICALIILLYAIFRISIPLVNSEPLYMDKNDGYVLLGSIFLLLIAETIKKTSEMYVKNKFGNNNSYKKRDTGGQTPHEDDEEADA